MKGCFKVYLDVDLKDEEYIKDLLDYVSGALENQLTNDGDFIEDWELEVEKL